MTYQFLQILRRFGLVAFIACWIGLFGLVTQPKSFEPWYAGAFAVTSLMVPVIAAWALWVILSGRCHRASEQLL